jgi:protease-4
MSTAYGSSPPPNPPQTVYVALAPPKPSIFARLLSLAQFLLFAFFVLAAIVAFSNQDALVEDHDSKIDERYYSLAKEGTNKVVILEVDGMITSGDEIRKQCEKAQKDSAVKAIVLRVNSPGGTITASDEIYHYLRKLLDARKIPLVVSMGGLAASGGYYISMACGDGTDVVFAEPTTWTGSIGVIIPHYNIAGLMEKLQIEEDAIKSAPLKAMGGITKKMTPEERKVFEELVKQAFDRFKGIVESGRPKLRGDKAALDKVATGQVFTTKQALELGLVDKEGFIEDAIKRALELASLDATSTKVVKYKKPKSVIDSLVGATASARSPFDLRAFFDAVTPRAYYLFAWPQAGE